MRDVGSDSEGDNRRRKRLSRRPVRGTGETGWANKARRIQPILAALPFVLAGSIVVPERLFAEYEVYAGTDDTEHTEVVHFSGGLPGCTGTFISQRLIVTAAHCTPRCPAGPGEACCDSATWECQDGSVTGRATDGLDPGTGNEWQIDYIYYPNSNPGCRTSETCPPDLAVMRTTTDLGRAPMPLMGPQDMPTGSNIGSYAGEIIEMVGYSSNGGLVPSRRRRGTTRVTGDDLDPPNRAYLTDGSTTGHVACGGDSGGPALFTNAYGEQQIGGVLSQGPVQCNPVPSGWGNDYAYIPRDFIDDLLCGEGWEFLGEHPKNAGLASPSDLVRVSEGGRLCRYKTGAAANNLVLLRKSGDILRWDGDSWRLIDDNPNSVEIATTSTEVFQRHSNGIVWKWDGGFRLWHQVDGGLDSEKRLAGSPSRLYQIRGNGEIYRCAVSGCDDAWDWQIIDDNPWSTAIAAGGLSGSTGIVVQLHGDHPDRSMWKHRVGFRDWQLIDQEPLTSGMSVGDLAIYKILSSGVIEQFTWIDPPGAWQTLDDNWRSEKIVARGGQLFQMHHGGNVWRWLGCFRCWINLGGAELGANDICGSEYTFSEPDEEIFRDGFESGDTSEWSSAEP